MHRSNRLEKCEHENKNDYTHLQTLYLLLLASWYQIVNITSVQAKSLQHIVPQPSKLMQRLN